MNNVAVLPYIGLHALQIQNVKRNVTKKASINELNLSNGVIENGVIVENGVEAKNGVIVENVSTTTKIDDLPSDKSKNE
jgi:hypothetical protein